MAVASMSLKYCILGRSAGRDPLAPPRRCGLVVANGQLRQPGFAGILEPDSSGRTGDAAFVVGVDVGHRAGRVRAGEIEPR